MSDQKDRPVIETHSVTWRAVASWIEAEMAKARANLERSGTPERESDELRGRLKALNDLLGLAKPKPEIPVITTNHVV